MAACRWLARSPDGPGPEDLEKESNADETCAGDTCRAGVWLDVGAGEDPGGCLSVSCWKTEAELLAMHREVSAVTARDKSPSDARVWARRAFWESCWSSSSTGGGLVLLLEVSARKESHKVSMSPDSNCLHRESTNGWILESELWSGLRRGTRKQSLA